jgi:hypothetical protein
VTCRNFTPLLRTGTCQTLCGTLRRRHPNSKLSGAAEGYVFLKDPLGQAKGGTERQTLKGKDTTKKFKEHKQNTKYTNKKRKGEKGSQGSDVRTYKGKGNKEQRSRPKPKENRRKETRLNARPSSTTLILNPKDHQCHPPTRQVALSLKAV